MSDLLSAASLLMAVIAILYSLWYPELAKALEIKPAKYTADNIAAMKQVQRVLLSKAIPLSMMALIVAIVFAPDAIKICLEIYTEFAASGCTAIKKYDAVRTAYVLVFIFSVVLASYVLILSCKIWKLWHDLQK